MDLRAHLLSITKPRPTAVISAELGEGYHVRVLTAGERDQFEADCADESTPRDLFRARLVCLCACDADGKPIFDLDTDVHALKSLPAYVLDPIVESALAANRMRPSDREDLRKNSATQPAPA